MKLQLPDPYNPTCLIATITYGSPFYKRIGLFRKFRDRTLLKRFGKCGKFLARLYYRLGVLTPLVQIPPVKKFLLYILLKPVFHILGYGEGDG